MNAAANAIPDWVIQLWLYQPLLLVISAVFGGLYVYFTVATFRQIKRQTDLQSEAFLVVVAQTLNSDPEKRYCFPQEAIRLHEKWRDILTRNLPNALQSDRLVILKFTNRGRADIVGWTVEVTARVRPGEYLSKNCNIRGDLESWRVSYKSHKDIVPTESGSGIEVPLAIIGAFPQIECDWTINYKDTRDVRYTKFGGDAHSEDVNALALAMGTASTSTRSWSLGG